MFTIGNEKIALVTDTSCDLADEQLRRYDIRLVSLRISTSRGEFRDRTELGQDELYQLLKTDNLKTSLPLPEDVTECYRQLRSEGCTRILHMTLSSGLSGTWNMVRLIAEDFDDIKIDVVDTMTLSCGLGLLVLQAAEMLKNAIPVDEVIAAIHRIRQTQLGAYVIRTLEYLRKGGRIGLVEGVVGSLLQIKPVIAVNRDGVYETLAKARGYTNAINTMYEEFLRRYSGKRVRIAVVHGAAYEEAVRFRDRLMSKLDVASIFISPVSPALAIHTGPGLVGAIIQEAEC